MRKLASIQRIKEICPIENAHNIELAKILNWQCVVKKGEFLVGDLVVYIEPDAVLPEDPRYDFLGDKCRIDKNGFKGYLIKVARMRGVFSQGLCLPLSILPGGTYESTPKLRRARLSKPWSRCTCRRLTYDCVLAPGPP